MMLGGSHLSSRTVVSLFFLAQFQPVIVDLLSEGKYAEMMVQKPETGPDLVTIV